MLTKVILPQLGDTMDEGTITRWYKREGERVTKGEPLFEVLTDKANIDVEATTDGYLRAVRYPENATVPTGQVIAYLTSSADEPIEPKLFVSPRARRIAKEFGVDVAQLVPLSKSGRIMEEDVRRFIAQRAPAPAPAPSVPSAPDVVFPAPAPSITQPEGDVIVPMAGVRKLIFDRMSASSREVARVTLTTEADATRLVELRAELNARQSEMKFSFTDLLVMLVARALLKHPYMNATLHEDGAHQHAFVNMGVATDTERGLLVPVLRDAHRKSLGEIYAELRRLSDAARGGNIAPDDLRGGTFTFTNLGQYEVDAFTPIVNQPETAILGIGRIAQKPAAYRGQLALRWMVTLSLSFDHRIVDGAPAARFLQQVKAYVEAPELILI